MLFPILTEKEKKSEKNIQMHSALHIPTYLHLSLYGSHFLWEPIAISRITFLNFPDVQDEVCMYKNKPYLLLVY